MQRLPQRRHPEKETDPAPFSRDKMADGKKPTEANVRAKVDEGGKGMRAYMLTDEEKDNLVAQKTL